MMDPLYKECAKYYDKLYENKDYSRESDFIDKCIKKFSKTNNKRLLDIGCGTGTHILHLHRKGYSVIGIDISKEMLEIAQNKILDAKLLRGNAKNFLTKKKCGCIIGMFTLINYMRRHSDLKLLMTNSYKNLEGGGLIIFDVGLCKSNSEFYKTKHITMYRDDKITIKRITRYKIGSDTYNKLIKMAVKNGNKIFSKTTKETYPLFDIYEIKRMMEEIGFKIKIFDDFSFKKPMKFRRPVFVGIKENAKTEVKHTI